MSYNIRVNIFRRRENEIDGVGGVLIKSELDDWGEILLDEQEEFDSMVQELSKQIRDETGAIVIHDIKQILEHVREHGCPEDELVQYLILVNREDVYIELEFVEYFVD